MSELTTQTEDSAVAEMAEQITNLFEETFNSLISQRDSELNAGLAPLDAERARLIDEQAQLDATAERLELLLPARERESSREANRLLLSGDAEGAAAKLREAETAREAPKAMRTRMEAINERYLDIDVEKRAVARDVYKRWFAKLPTVIRAAEHGLFIDLLDGIRADAYDFQDRHRSATVDTFGTMFTSLTAPERSDEWRVSQKWYSLGRSR